MLDKNSAVLPDVIQLSLNSFRDTANGTLNHCETEVLHGCLK